ncbi:Nudix hydrolase 8 [Vitis vinifera]|uniref:Nudix hydrolase 8 n=1 Tax=Vitis vinifera TaxID=29760 RepID=A0A438IHS1_VITVI|nr:Nudix hydrolase 8 [Vitis vinifera]
MQGKRGIWLKILLEQADLVPIAIQEGFNFHHAEPGYVMLTYWLPNEPCLLPASPSHQIGIGGFVMNHKREVLVVKEKCPCSCSGVWKLPTGYINKSEEIFSGAVREVKEETGIDTISWKWLLSVDEKEIQAAKWMPLDEFVSQPFYKEDHMSRKVIDICISKYDNRYNGFIAHQMTSKLDRKLSYLYYNEPEKI